VHWEPSAGLPEVEAVSAAVLILAAVAIGCIPAASALAAASWPRRSPAAAILLWQALGLGWGLAAVGALIGLGAAGEEGMAAGAEAGAEAMADGEVFDEENVWYAADAIPNGTAAAAALLEHRWAIPLRGTILRAGGYVLADEWIHAKDLIAVGLMAAAEANAEVEPAGT